MPPLRGVFDAGVDHFSFSTSLSKRSSSPDRDGGAEYGTWIQKVRGSYDYFGRPSDLKFGAWTRRTTRNHRGLKDLYGEELRGWRVAGNHRDLGMLHSDEFKGLTEPEDDHSGDTSPTLWEKAAAPKARPAWLVPIHTSSQSQAMAKYRQEMMELVKGVPESGYELSLRDLVELPMMVKPEEDVKRERGASEAVSPVAYRDHKDQKKHRNGKKQIQRSKSLDSGVFLLKMFFPPSLGGRRKSASTGSGSRVSPKPVLSDGEKGRVDKSMEAEWSEGRNGMGRGSLSNSTGQRRRTVGCYPFSINIGKNRWSR